MKHNKSKSFPIVAIGASAGGIEAVSELLLNVSSETGMAFIYIQHLDPTHESKLVEILKRKTLMEVQEARHFMAIKPNKVYIIPPNKELSIVNYVLKLNPRASAPSVHMPIDKFFLSLAEKHKEKSIGIILSGNATDGTFGIKFIKLAGGITIAQNSTAKFPSMPTSAIKEGMVDMVLSPADIAKELERISRHPAVSEFEMHPDIHNIKDNDVNLVNIMQLVKKSTGVDFTHYKITTIQRRIVRRMLLHKLNTLDEYLQLLTKQSQEVNVLYQDLLISVTYFFRDPDMMEYLKKSIFPQIINTKKNLEFLRIWVPACATGEEAYSLAIILEEILLEKTIAPVIQIFATDLSETAVERARLGVYKSNDLQNISKERIENFFEKIDGSYRIIKPIRDKCVFATHNLFKDPPFSRIDLISCCNLLIYLDPSLQKKSLSIFHYCLKSNGYLMLGKSETIGASPELFSQVEKKYKLYSKKNDRASKMVFDINYRIPGLEKTMISNNSKSPKYTEPVTNWESTVDDILMRQFVPASVVINQHLEILQFKGSTGLFFEPSQGRASLTY